MVITQYMGLTAWNLEADNYNSTQLATNFGQIDQHDHSPGNGKQISTAGIAANSITNSLLAANSVGSSNIMPGSVGSTQIANNAIQSNNIAPGAINLPIEYGYLSGNESIGDNIITWTSISSLAIGTWLINVSCTVSAAATGFVSFWVALGTASGVTSGTASASNPILQTITSSSSSYSAISFTTVVGITTAGSLSFFVESSISSAQMLAGSGFTAVRIA